jgi:hypothetical protein
MKNKRGMMIMMMMMVMMILRPHLKGRHNVVSQVGIHASAL